MEAFVIMPIRQVGSEEYVHFRSVYDDYIKATLEQMNYMVIRADEVQRSGAITQDIVTRLARADLVVADLTELNPNVFYELGVRHTLRGRGTVLLLDESKTDEIPFDLNAYRVVRYGSTLTAVARLRRGLEQAVRALLANPSGSERDNPVHDWLPSLPMNAVDAAEGSSEGKLRQELAALRQTLRGYETRYGILVTQGQDPDLSDRISELLAKAKAKSLAPDLLKAAQDAAASQDNVAYLEAVARLLRDKSVRISSRDYLRLSMSAANLDLSEASLLVLQAGMSLHPNDDSLVRSYLMHLAHSYDPDDREKARVEIGRRLGIDVSPDGSVSVGRELDAGLSLFGIMLDAYATDGLHEGASRLAFAVLQRYPESDMALRNYARSLNGTLEGTEGSDVALEWFRKAATVRGSDDVSATWFGNELHNRERYVDSIEAYALACVRDPDDATHWARVLEILSRQLELGDAGGAYSTRTLPSMFSYETAEPIALALFSCQSLQQSDVVSCEESLRKMQVEVMWFGHGFDIRAGVKLSTPDGVVQRLSLPARRSMANEFYQALRSELTQPPDGWEPTAPHAGVPDPNRGASSDGSESEGA